jgi:hypothetical protein
LVKSRTPIGRKALYALQYKKFYLSLHRCRKVLGGNRTDDHAGLHRYHRPSRGVSGEQTQRAIEAAGVRPLGTDAATLAALVRAEVAHWGPIIQRLNIRPES